MAQIAKQESQFDIKSSAERFYQTFCRKQYLLSKISPDVVKDVQVIKGDWESVGSIRQWTYVPAGHSSGQVDKVKTEAMDGKNKSTTFELLDGELKKEYKSFKVTLQVIDKSNGSGSTVKSVVEYEKQNENVPSPNKYFGFAHVLYKNIDTYLINNA